MESIEKSKLEPLFSEAQIRNRVRELAEQINKDYENKELTVLCVLKGSFIFFADLIRELDLPVSCEFLGLSSYQNDMISSGEVKVTLDINEPLEGKDVLVVEDIVDSGLTLSYLLQSLRTRRPSSVRTAALLVKPSKLEVDVHVDYQGFSIEDQFVVGYGLDYAQRFRELPYIAYVQKSH